MNAELRLKTLAGRVADACLDPDDGPARERRLREEADATSFDDEAKHKFLEAVLFVVDLYNEEEGDGEG